LLRVLFSMSPRTWVDGIEVIDVAEEHSRETLEALLQVFDILARADPRRYKRLKLDMSRVALMKAGHPEFASEVGACLIRSRYVREGDPRRVATTLVHEATHARLHRLGISYGRGSRGRVEELCVKQEVLFAERLEDPQIVAQLREELRRPWWTPVELHRRRITAWRQLGVPEWAVRLYERVFCAAPK
jgi:hypothetical protein